MLFNLFGVGQILNYILRRKLLMNVYSATSCVLLCIETFRKVILDASHHLSPIPYDMTEVFDKRFVTYVKAGLDIGNNVISSALWSTLFFKNSFRI